MQIVSTADIPPQVKQVTFSLNRNWVLSTVIKHGLAYQKCVTKSA